MVLVQKCPFFQLLFLGSIGQENVFYDILEQKIAFLAYKNKKLKKSKNLHFFKGVFQSWFWSKNGLFSNFFCWVIKARKMCLRYSRKKNAFLGYKKKKLKKSKNWHLSKGVKPWFWSKNGHFFIFFFFIVIDARKMSFTIL